MTKRARIIVGIVQLALSMLAAFSFSSVRALDVDRLRATMQGLGGRPVLFTEWRQMIHSFKNAAVAERLKKVNDFFNQKIVFASDEEVWSKSDHWATPMESLANGKGDCEDFVIAKYFTLLNMGIPDSQLRLIYVRARIGGPNSAVQQAHMVLAYYPSSDPEPLILDNLISDIRVSSRRQDLRPVFSFNGQGVFAGSAADSILGPGGPGRLSRWQDLLERARREGF